MDEDTFHQREVLAQLIRDCAEDENLSFGRELHQTIRGCTLRNNKYLANLLIHMYGRCGSVEEAKMVYDRIGQPNFFTQNIMMTAYAQNGHLREATWLLETMPEINVFSVTSLMQAYLRSGDLKKVKRLFDSFSERNVHTWTTMVQAYAENGHLLEARRLFELMPVQDGLIPGRNVVTWTTMLTAYAQAGDVHQARRLFSSMPCWNAVSWNALLAAYAEYGDCDSARSTFDQMPEWNTASWNALIACYAQNGHLPDAKLVFDSMPEQTPVSLTCLVQGYGQIGSFTDAKVLLVSTTESNPMPTTAVITAYAQYGLLQEALVLFARMPDATSVTWNAVVTAFVKAGRYNEGIHFYKRIEVEGLKFDDISFLNILTLCSHAGLLRLGIDSFISMQLDHGVDPLREHYCCMIDLLGRVGKLPEVEDLFNSMPFMPDRIIRQSVLHACGVHRDSRRAKSNFTGSLPGSAGYTLLANCLVDRTAEMAGSVGIGGLRGEEPRVFVRDGYGAARVRSSSGIVRGSIVRSTGSTLHTAQDTAGSSPPKVCVCNTGVNSSTGFLFVSPPGAS